MVKKILLTFVLVVLAVLVIANFWWQNQLSPVSQDSLPKAFVIAKGQGVSEIGEKLKAEGLIRSELAFKIYARQSGIASQIQAGTFKLSPSQSTQEIAETLTKGALDVWVTIVEGWRNEEIAERLNKDLGINREEFLELAEEGYMFPDTYLFPKEITIADLVGILKSNFEKRYDADLRAKIRDQGLTEKEGVILASIVEREGRSDKVRTEIAGILLRRLQIDMGLNVDASLQYALGYQPEENSWWKRHLTREDKGVNSLFNSYTYRGLPPTPICNPSLSSLNAVANADPDTPYLYYYHDSEGNSHYATTLDEHNINVANNP